MNTIFIKFFFAIICLFILIYVTSFAIYEIKTNKNIIGSIFSIFITFASIVFSNIMFWEN